MMNEKPLDRRIQKTRRFLFDALMSLTIEKGYENITIQDIIDRANVGRSTFYAHFENKEQLLFSGNMKFESMIESDIASDSVAGSGPAINYLGLFGHVIEKRELVRAMIGKKSGDVVINHLRDLVAIKISDYLKKRGDTQPQMIKFLAEAAAAALISLLSNWVEEDLPIPLEEMTEKARSLVIRMLE